MFPGASKWDPAAVHFSDVVYQWAEAVWIGEPAPKILEDIRGAACRCYNGARPGVANGIMEL